MRKFIENTFLISFPYWEKVALFRTALYVFLLINTLLLLPYAYELFAYNGAVGTRGWRMDIPWYLQGSEGLTNLLSHPINNRVEWGYLFFIAGQLFFLIVGMFGIYPKTSAVFIYFFTANLFLKGYLAFTGGEVLVNILLFYLIFIQKNRPKDGNKNEVSFSPLQNLVNNTFYWIILIQICMVYVYSVMYKLYDPFWLDGTALMYISRISVFSSWGMETLFSENRILSQIATYLVLFYQAFFPILVWFKRTKTPLLMLGIAIHLGIAFGMGIFSFGIIMILCYILFLSNPQITTLKRKFNRRD